MINANDNANKVKRIMISNHGEKKLVSMDELLEMSRNKSQTLTNKLANVVNVAATKCITVNILNLHASPFVEFLTIVNLFHLNLELFEYPVEKLDTTNNVMFVFKIKTGLTGTGGEKGRIKIGDKINSMLQTIKVSSRVLYQIMIPTQTYDILYKQEALE